MPDFTPEVLQSTALGYGDTTASFTNVANLSSVTVPDQPYGEVPYQHLAQTLEGFIGGSVQKAGELEFSCHYSAAQLNTLVGLRNASKYWRIDLPDTNGTIILQGFLRDIVNQPWDDPNKIGEIDCVIRPTSTITLTPGS